jgi:hypothetical protein
MTSVKLAFVLPPYSTVNRMPQAIKRIVVERREKGSSNKLVQNKNATSTNLIKQLSMCVFPLKLNSYILKNKN